MRQYFLDYNAGDFVYIAMNMGLGELCGVSGWPDTRAMIRGIITYEERFYLINKVSAGFVKELNVTELLKRFSLCLTQSYMGHTGYSATENTRFLSRHRQETVKVEGTKEWVRTLGIRDPEVEAVSAQKKEDNRG